MVNEKLVQAREFFNIEGFPGNLFNHITGTIDYINKYNLLLFKQDIEKTSGFIGYAEDNTAIICINYKMNIGHQNFTLAHELGHLFLHKGITICDTEHETNMDNPDAIEQEANKFAAELLYPEKYVKEDFQYIICNKLITPSNSLKLADFINEISIKYCVSFKFAFLRIFFLYNPQYAIKKYEKIHNCVGKISERYNDYDHIYVEGHPYYHPYMQAFQIMKEYVEELVQQEEISYETGEVIINRNMDLEGCK